MIRIAVPNKGRLADAALELLEQAGYADTTRGDRALQADLGDEVQAVFVRARDIAEFVDDGVVDLGVTGRDLVAEAGRELTELLDLGFGRCRMVLAARDGVTTEMALAGAMRVATSFPRTAARWFAERGAVPSIVPVSGAAEIAPHMGVADVIVDLVGTGSTLRVNGLREVETLFESTAVLVTRADTVADPARGRAIGEIVGALESVLRARDKRYLMANVRRDTLEEVKTILPGISGPTIVEVLDGGEHVAAHAVVDRRDVPRVVASLKRIGAEGILVTRIERLMP
ncbi:MAG TPA: ATP phosphoribosyltransferase [Longimicrobiales bacterium]|nr:ATP phosphoribosyltransferase [Longimicrobiales bacterium]